MFKKIMFTAAVLLAATSNAAMAKDYVINLNGNKFEPARLEIPANKKVKLLVKNNNKAAAEFESHSLKREKIISAGAQAAIFIGPLKPGKYEYFDEFQKNVTGIIVAK